MKTILCFFMLLLFCVRVESGEKEDKNAMDYYDDYKSIILCKADKNFLFQKREIRGATWYEYMLIVKVIKILNSEQKIEVGESICLFKRYSKPLEKFEGHFYLGLSKASTSVIILEPDNLCPEKDILRRVR